jgi:hypothetical protein
VKYLTLYLSTLAFLAPSLGWSANPKCLADEMLQNTSVQEIKKFQRQNWESQYRSYFESQAGKSPLCEEVGESEKDERMVLSLPVIQMMSEFEGPSIDHVAMKKKLVDLTGHYLNDSQRIWIENVFDAGVKLTHESHPTAQQVYDAIKNTR